MSELTTIQKKSMAAAQGVLTLVSAISVVIWITNTIIWGSLFRNTLDELKES